MATDEVQDIPAQAFSVLSPGVEECWMDFDGARMRYLRAGAGPALVLLHGLLGYSFSWRFTMPALAPYATVYAPDMLGAGFSDRPRGIDHSIHGTALRVLRFVENLGISSFDLLGTSRGGAVAMAVAAECVFTTHTPVPAGHDRFSTEQSVRILGNDRTARLEKLGVFEDGLLNMTLLALRFSRYANGVAMQHGKVSREMFPEFHIDSITNGVHAPTWVSEPMQQMFDAHIPSWRRDNLFLRNAIDLPEQEILNAHRRAKEALLTEVATRTGLVLNPNVLTLGFARRAATYKRASLLLADPERLFTTATVLGALGVIDAAARPSSNL